MSALPESPAGPQPDAAPAAAAGLRQWLGSGACQSACGAFVAWVDLGSGAPGYDYPEITGYAIGYLAGLLALSERERAAGHRAAAWLVGRVRAGALAARDSWDAGAVYLFDLAMIASGLLSFGAREGVDEYVESGLDLTRLLVAEIGDGSALEPLARAGPRSGRASWSTRGRAHLAKLVQALLLADEAGGSGGRAAAARVVEAVMPLQAPDGSFDTGEDGSAVMLHPHLYAAEGLWMWGEATCDARALDGARAAVAWAWERQLEHGGLPRAAPGSLEQSDATAQAVRLGLALGGHSLPVERAVARLVDVARPHAGGLAIPYQPGSPDVHLNTWATLFAAQALAATAPAAPALSWRELV